MNVVAVIPARYGSKRFPGKPLAMIMGKPMVQWVYENTRQCSLVDRVIVATDDDRIDRVVRDFGGESCLTAKSHETGTDRIYEAIQQSDAHLIINVQGDEPLLPPEAITRAVEPLLQDNEIYMGTLKTRIEEEGDIIDPHVVKVVTDTQGFALYFSRAPIPHVGRRGNRAPLFRHIGLYVYRKDFLSTFTALPRSGLEVAEDLEQLRALEHGFRIYVAETGYQPLGVDLPEDIARVEKLMTS